MERSIPRDRNSAFDPLLVPKHPRRLAGLDEKILAMYARGMTVRDISAPLEELYGAKLPDQRPESDRFQGVWYQLHSIWMILR